MPLVLQYKGWRGLQTSPWHILFHSLVKNILPKVYHNQQHIINSYIML